MNPAINPDLLKLLACPECGSPLSLSSGAAGAAPPPGGSPPAAGRTAGEELLCPACGRSFGLENGIPLLFPTGIDRAHIEEEEKLGELMATHEPSGKELLYELQWSASKEEYWDFVRERIAGAQRTILNAGCGVDRRFLDLAGYGTLVAFDLMPSLLERLRTAHGSKNNVAGAVQALPFAAGSFDCVCCIDLLHHEPAITG